MDEAQSRLQSLLSVCQHELAALRALGDERLDPVIASGDNFQAEIVAALAAFPPPPANGAAA